MWGTASRTVYTKYPTATAILAFARQARSSLPELDTSGAPDKVSQLLLIDLYTQTRTFRHPYFPVYRSKRLCNDAFSQKLRTVQCSRPRKIVSTVENQRGSERHIWIGQPAAEKEHSRLLKHLDLPPGREEAACPGRLHRHTIQDRKSTRLNSSHVAISY